MTPFCVRYADKRGLDIVPISERRSMGSGVESVFVLEPRLAAVLGAALE